MIFILTFCLFRCDPDSSSFSSATFSLPFVLSRDGAERWDLLIKLYYSRAKCFYIMIAQYDDHAHYIVDVSFAIYVHKRKILSVCAYLAKKKISL